MLKKNMKFIIGILITLVTIAGLVIGGSIFIEKQYGINVLETLNQIGLANEEINESEYFPSEFSDSDMQSAMTACNSKISNLISYSTEDGYNLSTDGLSTDSVLSDDLLLTDKQLGALLNNILTNGSEAPTLSIGKFDLKLELVQVRISNVDEEEKTADFNYVVKIDISDLKAELGGFPLNLITDRITNTFYISSTNTIIKGDNPFEYTIESKELCVNKLDASQTENILNIINMAANFGTIDELNLSIGTPIINALIGSSESNPGFAYSLSNLGATDYAFVTISEVNYFVIKK